MRRSSALMHSSCPRTAMRTGYILEMLRCRAALRHAMLSPIMIPPTCVSSICEAMQPTELALRFSGRRSTSPRRVMFVCSEDSTVMQCALDALACVSAITTTAAEQQMSNCSASLNRIQFAQPEKKQLFRPQCVTACSFLQLEFSTAFPFLVSRAISGEIEKQRKSGAECSIWCHKKCIVDHE
jgi:hypothetical protein